MRIVVSYWGIAPTFINPARSCSFRRRKQFANRLYISNRIECYIFFSFSDQQTQYQAVFLKVETHTWLETFLGSPLA